MGKSNHFNPNKTHYARQKYERTKNVFLDERGGYEEKLANKINFSC